MSKRQALMRLTANSECTDGSHKLMSSTAVWLRWSLFSWESACRFFCEFIQFFLGPNPPIPCWRIGGEKKEVIVVELCCINTGSQTGGSLFSICILLDFPNFSTLPHCLPSPMCSISEFEIWIVSLQNKPLSPTRVSYPTASY